MTEIESSSNEEITFKELLSKFKIWVDYLLSKWVFIFIIGSVGALLGLIYSKTSKPLYKAHYSFVLEDEKSGGFGGALGLASQFGVDLGGSSGGGAFTLDNLLHFMKSRAMVQKALLSPIDLDGKTVSILDYYNDYTGLQASWKEKPGLAGLSFPILANPKGFSRLQDSIMNLTHEKIVKNFLTVDKVDKKLNIIKVEVVSTDELFSKYFTEALVSVVSSFYVETKTKKSMENVAVLQHQTDSVRRQLNRAIAGIAQSTDNTPNLNTSKQILRVPSQQRQVDVQANTAILTELVKNLELAKLTLRKETPFIQDIDKPIFPLPFERVGVLKGVVIGSFLFGIVSILFLIVRKFLIDIQGKS